MNKIKPTYEELEKRIEVQEKVIKRLEFEKDTTNQDVFQSLFADSQTIKILLDPKSGNIINANQAASNFYGYSIEELVLMNINQINTLPQHSIDEELKKSGISDQFRFNYKHRLKDGVVKDIEAFIGQIRIKDQNLIYANIHDVTEINQANNTIKKNNERLESLMKISQYKSTSVQELFDFTLNEAVRLCESKYGFIFLYDDEKQEFSLNTWSKGVMDACDMLEKQTLYRLNDSGCWAEAVRQKKPIIINDLNNANEFSRGVPQGHISLSKFLSIPVWSDNKIVAAVGVANKSSDYDYEDIRQLTLLMDSVWKIVINYNKQQEIKEANKKLEQNERKLRRLFENMGEGFAFHKMIYDENNKPIDYRYISANHSFEKLTGLKVADIIGKTVKEILPNTEQVWIENYGKVAQTGMPLKFENYSRDLDKYYTVNAYSPEEGYFASIFSDVTENRKYELALLNAIEKSEESNRLKSAFLDSISHEFRTPMNGILGFADLIKDPDNTNEDRELFSTMIKDSCDQLLNIVTDTIEISKIQSNATKVCFNTCCIKSIITEVMDAYEPKALEKGLKFFRQVIWDNDDFIMSDEHMLRSSLRHLIDNAIKYTSSGSVDIVCAKKGNSDILISIEDTGIGIPNNMQENIFKPFYKGDEKISRNYGGCGIGLSLSYAYIKLLGGDVRLKSKVGEGTIVLVNLPIKKLESEELDEISMMI